jgi:integrase
MGVFTRKGSWWIDFRDQHGRRHRKKVGNSKKFAEKVLAKAIAEVAEHRFLDIRPDVKTTFEELATEYRKHIQHRAHFRKDDNRLKQLEKQFKGKLLVEITTLEVDRYRQKVTPRGKIAWNRLRSMLHHMFEMGKRWGMCEHNPVSAVERYKESAGKTRFLSPKDELLRFIAAASQPDLPSDTYALLVTAIFTGLRKSELFRLKWTEVDFTTSTIHVNRLAKSRRSREVPMAAPVREALLDQQSRTGKLPYVFCTSAGKPFKDRRETLENVLARAGITDFTWHDLRHCFASYLAMAGVDLIRIKELLGHSDVKMTLRYAHLSPSFVRESVQRLDRLLLPATPPEDPQPKTTTSPATIPEPEAASPSASPAIEQPVTTAEGQRDLGFAWQTRIRAEILRP